MTAGGLDTFSEETKWQIRLLLPTLRPDDPQPSSQAQPASGTDRPHFTLPQAEAAQLQMPPPSTDGTQPQQYTSLCIQSHACTIQSKSLKQVFQFWRRSLKQAFDLRCFSRRVLSLKINFPGLQTASIKGCLSGSFHGITLPTQSTEPVGGEGNILGRRGESQALDQSAFRPPKRSRSELPSSSRGASTMPRHTRAMLPSDLALGTNQVFVDLEFLLCFAG